MAEVGIFVGTVYGNALRVAKESQVILSKRHKAIIYEDPDIADWKNYNDKYVLLITSTTGHGDLPDNIAPLYLAIKKEIDHQTGLHYGIIALGDSSYHSFCNGGKQFDMLLQKYGAQRVGTVLFIDAAKHLEAKSQYNQWLEQWMTLIS